MKPWRARLLERIVIMVFGSGLYFAVRRGRNPRLICALAWLFTASLARAAADSTFSPNTLPVGEIGSNLYSTPINQLLSPVGRQIELPGSRPQAMALSPSGRLLAVSGKTAEIVLIDAFEDSAAVLGAGHWVRWHFVEARPFTDPTAVVAGIERGLKRLAERG